MIGKTFLSHLVFIQSEQTIAVASCCESSTTPSAVLIRVLDELSPYLLGNVTVMSDMPVELASSNIVTTQFELLDVETEQFDESKTSNCVIFGAMDNVMVMSIYKLLVLIYNRPKSHPFRGDLPVLGIGMKTSGISFIFDVSFSKQTWSLNLVTAQRK